MTEQHTQAGEPAETPFERPPVKFTDTCGRDVDIRRFDGRDQEALVDLYEAIDPEDRAQGLPPLTTTQIESWLDDILETGIHLVAWHGERAVGHACLLPAGELGHELAIFVRSSYQRARIGTRLLRALLGQGMKSGVDRVWLTVQHDNTVAINLYRSVGFERFELDTGTGASQIEMVRDL